MKKAFVVCLVSVLLVGSGFAQMLKLTNKVNLQVIENVLVYNLDKSHSEISDINGKVELSGFSETDTLILQHPSFVVFLIPLHQLEALDYKIQLDEKSINLSEIVISANKWEQNRAEVPNKISSISRRELEFHNPQTAADLIGLTKEVFIQKSQFGGGSPMIRGFSANSVLIVVDGTRMNNAIFRSGNLQNIISIDPSVLESAEVIFGPGSIIYGSDALGGVMDFHTRKVKLSTNEKSNVKANVLLRYASANNEKTTHFDLNFAKKKWGFFSSVSFSDFDDLRMGDNSNSSYQRLEYAQRVDGQDQIIKNSDPNIQRFSGFQQLSIMQKVRFKASKDFDLNYNFIYSTTTDIPRYDRLIQYSDYKLKYAEWYYGPQDWMMHSLKLDLKKKNSFYNNAQIGMAYQFFKESRHNRKFGKDILNSRTESVDAISLNLDFEKELGQSQTLFYGAEGIYNYVKSTGFSTNILTGDETALSTRYPDGGSDYLTSAIYSSYKNNISSFLTLSAGLRLSQVYSRSVFKDTSFYKFPYNEIEVNTGALNGSLGLVYHPAKEWQFNVNASSGYRAPNIDDVAKVFDSEPGNVVVPNDNLQPEYAYNLDFGIVKRFNESAKIDFTLFYTYLNNAMARREFTFNDQDSIMYDGTMSQVWAIVNVGHANIYGGNVAVNVRLSKALSFETYLTYQRGEDSDGFPVRHVSPLFGSTSLTLTKEKLKIMIYADYNGTLSNKNLAPSEQSKAYMYASDKNGDPYSPGWCTFNIKTSYQINTMLQLEMGIENFFDLRYRPYSSGIVAPGRNFIVSLRGSI
jgi:outer membrane receptor protein involved in Fe transport